MWSLDLSNPIIVDAQVLTRMPDAMRRAVRTDWADANKPGHLADSFLEGPSFDRAGNLYLTDIPHGRILRVTPALEWQEVAQTGGWPNGLALHRDGSLWVTDYRLGILRIDVDTGRIETVLGHRNSESFKGVNDLVFDAKGNVYFTDQGQSGLHDPSGRVYRYRTSGQLDLIMHQVPSPNGIVLSTDERFLFVSVTRANAVWRGPLLADGAISKVGAFRTFFGTSGPDGLALDAENGLIVAHASLGCAFRLNAMGEVTHIIRSPLGKAITNVAFRPGTSTLVITDSDSGTVLSAELPVAGAPIYSHG